MGKWPFPQEPEVGQCAKPATVSNPSFFTTTPSSAISVVKSIQRGILHNINSQMEDPPNVICCGLYGREINQFFLFHFGDQLNQERATAISWLWGFIEVRGGKLTSFLSDYCSFYFIYLFFAISIVLFFINNLNANETMANNKRIIKTTFYLKMVQ